MDNEKTASNIFHELENLALFKDRRFSKKYAK
jgi:hypothetical protein